MNDATQSHSIPQGPDREAHASSIAIDQLPVPYVEVNRKGEISAANRAALDLFSSDKDPLVGSFAWKLMATDEREISFASYFSAIESGRDMPPVCRPLFDRSGQFRTYQLYCRLVRDAQGKPDGMSIVLLDVTETLNALDAATRSAGWMESIVDSAPEAILVTDTVGFICALNPACEKLLCCKAEALKGKLVEEGVHLLTYSSSVPDGQRLTHLRALDQPTRGNATVHDGFGRELHIEISTSPLIEKDSGITEGVVHVLRKIG
jgi:PAS domain S-box-containing protein